MYKFGKKSLEQLETCDLRLQEICHEAIKVMDFSVLEGHRDAMEQENMFLDGKSQLRFPNSKHNQQPSKAVDIAPYPIDWSDKERFARLAGLMFGIAHCKGIKLRWGGTWGGLSDNKSNFVDLPHFEIMG